MNHESACYSSSALLAASSSFLRRARPTRPPRRLPPPPDRVRRRGDARNGARFRRVDRDARRPGQRPDSPAGLGLSGQDGLPGRRGRQEGRRPVRDRSATVRSGAGPGRGAARQARAQLGRTSRTSQRDKPLAKERAIAQSQLDNDVQAKLAARGVREGAEAMVEAARLNLELHAECARWSVASRRSRPRRSAIWSARQTLLTTVSQVDPIRAYFSLSEQEYLRGRHADQRRTARRKSLWATARR